MNMRETLGKRKSSYTRERKTSNEIPYAYKELFLHIFVPDTYFPKYLQLLIMTVTNHKLTLMLRYHF
jgi:hypothetical protein